MSGIDEQDRYQKKLREEAVFERSREIERQVAENILRRLRYENMVYANSIYSLPIVFNAIAPGAVITVDEAFMMYRVDYCDVVNDDGGR